VLLTGGRIKIGFQVALICLRSGCAMLHVTTRFPKDCARRFAREKDWPELKPRLRIYGLGMRREEREGRMYKREEGEGREKGGRRREGGYRKIVRGDLRGKRIGPS
jgi:hypothetical protein